MPYARRHSNGREDRGHTRQVRYVHRLGFCWPLEQHARAAKDCERTEDIVKGDVEDVRCHHAKASIWVEPVVRESSVQNIGTPLVHHLYSLRLACRARGVHDIRQVVRPHARRRRRAQAHPHSRRLRLRHAPCVLQRHHAVGRHAAHRQPRSHPRRARVQLGVAHRVAAPLERHRVGRARRLRRHQLVHAQLGREGRRRLVEAAQHTLRLRRRQQRQRPRVVVVRRARQRLRQRCQPRRQPLDALAREKFHLGHAAAAVAAAVAAAATVANTAAATAAAVCLAGRVPAGGLHLHLRPKAAATGLRATAPAPFWFPREHRLEDGVARRVVRAPWQLLVHELLEGQRRVRHSAHRRLARRAQQRSHRAAARRRDAQRQHVDEVADQPLGARHVAPMVRRAHHQLLLPRVPAQQQRPQREHQLEERASVRARRSNQPRRHRCRQRHRHAVAAEGLPRGPREVERQLERRQRALKQRRPPVRAVRPQVFKFKRRDRGGGDVPNGWPLRRCCTDIATAINFAVCGGTGQQAKVHAGIPGGPRLAEGQPRVFHCALRLDEAGAATQQRFEPQRHARHRGEEEDHRVAGVGVERDGGVRAAGHALHECGRVERHKARLRAGCWLYTPCTHTSMADHVVCRSRPRVGVDHSNYSYTNIVANCT
eukprot:scaffold14468_cov64-Phaeocystis_antarctica.AAC.8